MYVSWTERPIIAWCPPPLHPSPAALFTEGGQAGGSPRVRGMTDREVEGWTPGIKTLGDEKERKRGTMWDDGNGANWRVCLVNVCGCMYKCVVRTRTHTHRTGAMAKNTKCRKTLPLQTIDAASRYWHCNDAQHCNGCVNCEGWNMI